MGRAGGLSPFRRLMFPAILSLVLTCVAVSLGIWQVERLAWKTDLLARIDAAEAAPALPLTNDPAQFTKTAVTGIFRPMPPALYGAEVRDTQAGPRMGARLILPLDRPNAPPILIDRGWAPTDREPPPAPKAAVTIEGYIRTTDRPGWFAATDDLAARRFYTLDPRKMAESLGAPDAVPYVLIALGKATIQTFPQPATALPRPPNDHLAYAVTWFSLAAILVIIFAIYARKVFRE